MDNEILKGLNFIPEKGGLFIKDVRHLLIRPETIVTFQKAIEKELGEKASHLLFESGWMVEPFVPKDNERSSASEMKRSFTS